MADKEDLSEILTGYPSIEKRKKEILKLYDVDAEMQRSSRNLEQKIKNLPEKAMHEYLGFGHRVPIGGTVKYVYSEDEKKVAEGKGSNSFIVMGRDRPSANDPGYGFLPGNECASIDLVVGRYGRHAKVSDKDSSPIPDKEIVVPGNDFINDAARIYICEKTDIDINFGLVPGRIGNPRGRSAIGIKADNVRIMAREGIKLVTRPDRYNSKDGKMDVVVGVDIIAGDDDSDLQPMVKGDNLIKLLRYMIDDSRRLAQMIHSLSVSQASLETMLAAHTHATVGGTISIPSVELGIHCGFSQIKRLTKDITSQISHTLNQIAMELDFVQPTGTRYINSKSNNVN